MKYTEQFDPKGAIMVASKGQSDAVIDALIKARALDAADRVLTDLTDDRAFTSKAVNIIETDLSNRLIPNNNEKAGKAFSESIKRFSEDKKSAILTAQLRAAESVADSNVKIAQVEKQFKSPIRG